MTIRFTNNSFNSPSLLTENTFPPRRVAKPSQSNKSKEMPLLKFTMIKTSRSLLELSACNLNFVLEHKAQVETPIKESHKQRLLEKVSIAMNRVQFTPQQKLMLESITTTEANQAAKKEINSLRKNLPEALRIALKTDDIIIETQKKSDSD